MALIKNVTTDEGFECYAYLTVVHVSLNKGMPAQGVLQGFKSPEDRDAGFKPVIQKFFTFDYDINSSENILAQSYLHIKSLPDFSDSVDA